MKHNLTNGEYDNLIKRYTEAFGSYPPTMESPFDLMSQEYTDRVQMAIDTGEPWEIDTPEGMDR